AGEVSGALWARGGEREPDVAARDRVDPAGSQTRGEHPGRGRLAVRPGDGEVRAPCEPRAELQLTPDIDPPLLGPHDGRRVGWDARAHHDDLRAVQIRRFVAAGPNL